MGNIADCCSKNPLVFDSKAIPGDCIPPEPYDSAVKGIASSNRSASGTTSSAWPASKKEGSHKSGNRLISLTGSNDTHKRYMTLLEERRKQLTGGYSDTQKNWDADDTEMIESTLYLDETTAYQGPLTDDETGV
jgi:hypothetical protein